jgi:hypothetical protein
VAAAAVALGGDHAAAVSADGRVFAWGSNAYGQLGPAARGAGGAPAAHLPLQVPLDKPLSDWELATVPASRATAVACGQHWTAVLADALADDAAQEDARPLRRGLLVTFGRNDRGQVAPRFQSNSRFVPGCLWGSDLSPPPSLLPSLNPPLAAPGSRSAGTGVSACGPSRGWSTFPAPRRSFRSPKREG